MECNMNAPIYRAASKTTETGPNRAPEDPLKMVPERLTFMGFFGGSFHPLKVRELGAIGSSSDACRATWQPA